MSHASEGPRNRLLTTFVNAEIILASFEFSSRGIIHQQASAMGDYIQSAYIGKNVFIENFKELPKPNLMDFLYILIQAKRHGSGVSICRLPATSGVGVDIVALFIW